ncbi:formin-like protein 16 [Arachis duranensis]|uniref:Formin-like protein 16 n=1 Tax=Arachis duranensis TaxID=130453 RepID=A0A6P4C249_ARADU|nr:formin-like protein 16 [Arachis duranensis]
MKNDNTVHLYFDYPIDANLEIIDENVVSDGSSKSVVEINPPGQTNERENEAMNEATGEVNELNKALSVVVNETVNEVVTEATVDVNKLNKDGNTTTNAAPPNADTIPAASTLGRPSTSSEPAPPMTTRPTGPTPTRRGRPTFVRGNPVLPRGRGSTTQRGLIATSTTPLTPTQNAAAAPPPPAQPRVVKPAIGSKSQIPASPSSVAVPCSGSGSMPQGPTVRPTL